MMKEIPAQPRVISYKRFSSMRQSKGDSLRRQTAAAEEWCARRGWKLDAFRPTDLGLSGYSGAARTRGALKKLLDLVEAGSIARGTYLLIEALDRLSREALVQAVPMFLEVINSGVIIVTLDDNKEWTAESVNRQEDFMYSVMLMGKAHAESLHKGRRVKDRFKEGRGKQSRQEFGSAPGWLTRERKEAPWTIIEERAVAVRRVFELAAAGYGSKAIAKRANEEGWPIPTRDTEQKPDIWHATMPGRLLRMREVTGAHEYRLMSYEDKKEAKHWRGKASGIDIPDYYPRIVSDELWHRARASIETRKTGNVRRDEHYFNIWSGLMRCGNCGAMIQRKTEYRGQSKAQLICSNKMAGLTDCQTGAASKTDEPLLHDICAIGGALMGLGYDKNKARQDIAVATSKLKENHKQGENIANAIAALGPLPELLNKARAIREEREQQEAIIEQRQQCLAMEPNSMLDTSYADGVLKVLHDKTPEAKEIRADCNNRLRQAIEGVWHFAYDCALVKYKESGVVQHIALKAKTKRGEHPKLAAFAEAVSRGEPIKLLGLTPLEPDSFKEHQDKF